MALNRRKRVRIHQKQDDLAVQQTPEHIDMAPNTRKRRKLLAKPAPVPAPKQPARPKPPKKTPAPREPGRKRRLNIVEGGLLQRLRRHRIRLLVALLVLLVAVALVVGNLLVPAGLTEWMQNTVLTWGSGKGLPLTVGDDSVKGLYTRGSLSFVLTDSHLYAYTTAGKEVSTIQHGYLSPVVDVAQTRTLIYDRGNGSLRIDTLGRNAVSEKYERSILTADLADSGVFAVAFDDAEYASTVSVYDKNGSTPALLQLSYSEEDVTAVKLSPNGKTLATVTVRSQGGAFSSCLRLYKVKTGQKLCEETVSGSMAVTLIGSSSRVFMASSSGLMSLNWEGGERKTYEITNLNFLTGEGGKHLCVACNPSGGREDTVLLLNRKGEEEGRFAIEGDYRRLCVGSDRIWARYADRIDVYDLTGQKTGTLAVGYETGYLAPCGRGLAVTSDMELRYYE